MLILVHYAVANLGHFDNSPLKLMSVLSDKLSSKINAQNQNRIFFINSHLTRRLDAVLLVICENTLCMHTPEIVFSPSFQTETSMAFAGILKDEDISAAVEACQGLFKNTIPIQTYTNHRNTSHSLIQQLLHK